MDYTSGYSASWRVVEVDTATWADGDSVPGVDSVEVDRVRDGLVESGSMDLTVDPGASFPERYLRVVMVAEQDGAERAEVATMLFSSSACAVDHGVGTATLEGRSVLWPASTRRLLAGTYAPKGADGAEYAAGLLRECCACPVAVEGSFTLGSHIVFDIDSTYLEACWDVLDAGGYCLKVDGRGTVHVGPRPSDPALVLEAARVVASGVESALDLSEIPNRYLAVDDDLAALAVNDDPGSEVSTVRRGYCVDVVDSSPKPLEDESMPAYASRKLHEASVVEDSRTYEREWAEGVHPWDVVRCSIPAAGLSGDFRVKRQSIECGKGITVTEEACKEVSLWQ